MARAWVYDRQKTARYRDAAAKAKRKGAKPPARWAVMYYDVTGTLRSEYAATKSKADERRGKLEESLNSGTYSDPSLAKVTFADMGEKWLEARHDLKRSTWWKYRGLLDNHIVPQWGALPLNKITRENIDVWVATLLRPTTDGGSGLGPSQARHAYRVLAMVLEWCTPSRIPSNPARGVKLPVRPDAEHVYLSYQQVEQLAEAAAKLRTKYDRPTACAAVNKPLILLLAYTGVRWGEAAALRVGRVDLERRRIRVASTLYEVNGVHHEGLPKTGKRRTVSFPASLVPVLQPLPRGRTEDEYLFTTARGEVLRSNNWRVREFNTAASTATLKVDGLTPHKLRHTAASLAINAGADVKVVQQMLGHADASMTLNVYGHLFPDRLDEVADVLDVHRGRAVQKLANDDAA